MSSAFNKTAGTSVLALQTVASGATLISSVLDVATKLAATFFIHFGRTVAAALTVGANIRVEASSRASGDGHWFPVAIFTTQEAAAADEAVNGACASGQAEVPMASTTGFAVGDIIFIQNGTIGNSEWGRINLVHTNVHVTLEQNLANTQTGSSVYGAGEMFVAQVDCAAITRLRVVLDNSGTGQTIAVQADAVTCDSIGA